jgi:hypothetical protein
MERAYNFHELINCVNALNQLSAVEYGENGLQFGRAHNNKRMSGLTCTLYKKEKILLTLQISVV